VITVAKDVLEAAVKSVWPEATLVRSKKEENQTVKLRKWPIVSIVSNPSGFDDRGARTYRYYDEEAGTYMERYIRGSWIGVLLMWCYAENEEAADDALSAILPVIPRKWTYDGLEGLVVINGMEYSDFTDNVINLYKCVAEIQFTVDIATRPVPVPTITETEIEDVEWVRP
jgi:hypothetical protein